MSGPAPLDGLASSNDAEDVAGDATVRAAPAAHLQERLDPASEAGKGGARGQ